MNILEDPLERQNESTPSTPGGHSLQVGGLAGQAFLSSTKAHGVEQLAFVAMECCLIFH